MTLFPISKFGGMSLLAEAHPSVIRGHLLRHFLLKLNLCPN